MIQFLLHLLQNLTLHQGSVHASQSGIRPTKGPAAKGLPVKPLLCILLIGCLTLGSAFCQSSRADSSNLSVTVSASGVNPAPMGLRDTSTFMVNANLVSDKAFTECQIDPNSLSWSFSVIKTEYDDVVHNKWVVAPPGVSPPSVSFSPNPSSTGTTQGIITASNSPGIFRYTIQATVNFTSANCGTGPASGTTTITVDVRPADFSLGMGSISVYRGKSASTSVGVSSLHHFVGTVGLSVSGGNGITATVTPTSVSLADGETKYVTISVTADATAPLGSQSLTLTGTSASAATSPQTVPIAVTVLCERSWDSNPGISVLPSGPLVTEVLPGATLTPGVTANDMDALTVEGGSPTLVADSLTYAWSDGSSGTSASVTAPAMPGPFSVTCTVSDAGVMQPGDCGNRHDPSASYTFSYTVVNKVWTTGSPIQGGDLVGPSSVTVDPGGSVSFGVTAATDSDHWRQGSAPLAQGDEPDAVTYRWSGPGLSSTGAGGTWTAPVTPGTYTLTCTINDKGGPVVPPDSGNRKDGSITRTLTVIVPPKKWDAGDPIKGGLLSTITEVDVVSGGTTGYGVTSAVDIDHWIQGSQQGTAADKMVYDWSGGGTFSSPSGAAGTWTAPVVTASQDFTLTCHLHDVGGPVILPDIGTRTDGSGAAQNLLVHVYVGKVWDVGTPIQGVPTGPTPEATVSPGGTVSYAAPGVSDTDHWVVKSEAGAVVDEGTEADSFTYAWSGGGSFGDAAATSGTWTAPTAPGDYTLTCKVTDKGGPVVLPDTGTRADGPLAIPVLLVHVLQPRVWDVGTPIQGVPTGPTPETTVSAGDTLSYSAPGLSDSDHWVIKDVSGTVLSEGTEADSFTYAWSGGGSFGDAAATSGTWTAPTTPGDYTLTCKVTDKGGPVVLPDTGSRQDTSGLAIPVLLVHVLAPRIWDAGTPIQGGLLASTLPVTVSTGDALAVSVSAATDNDHWHRPNGTEGTASDGIVYAWSGGGSFSDTAAASNTWTAPTTPGDYTLTCTVSDKGGPVVLPDTGTRADGASPGQSLLVHVVPKGDFSLTTGSVTLAPGRSATANYTVSSINGFKATVAVAGGTIQPTATSTISATVDPSSVYVTPDAPGVGLVTVSADCSVPDGTYSVPVSGTSGKLSHTASVSVTVARSAADFGLSLDTGAAGPLVIKTTKTGTATAVITDIGSFADPVSLSLLSVTNAAGADVTATCGIGVTFNPNPAASTSTVTITAGTISGVYSLTIQGVDAKIGCPKHTATLTVTVIAPPSSYAELMVCAINPDGSVGSQLPTASTQVGSDDYGVLSVTVGPNERLASGQADLLVTEDAQAKDGSPLHAPPGNIKDLGTFLLGDSTIWEKQTVAASGTTLATWAPLNSLPVYSSARPNGPDNTPPGTANPDTSPSVYRTKQVWHTAAGHNGAHSLSLTNVDNNAAATQLSFASTGSSYTSGPAPASADVHNLIITSISPEQTVCVDDIVTAVGGPNDKQDIIPFKVALDDYTPGLSYNYILTIRDANDPTTVVKTIPVGPLTGLTQTIEWDLTDDLGNYANIDDDYFTYDLSVSNAATLDGQSYRSPTLLVAKQKDGVTNALDLSLAVDISGSPLPPNGSGQYQAVLKYKLTEPPLVTLPGQTAQADNSQLGSVRFSQDQTPLDTVTGLTKQKCWTTPDPNDPTSPDGPFDPPIADWLTPDTTGYAGPLMGILAAKDSLGANYRDHKPRRMLNYAAHIKSYYIHVDSDDDRVLAGNGSSSLSKTTVHANVEDENGNPISGVAVNFSSDYMDAGGNATTNAAGTITVNAANGDSLITDSNGKAQATLTAGSKLGNILVSGQATPPGGISTSDDSAITFDAPNASVTYSGWVAMSGSDNRWTQSYTAFIDYYGTSVSNQPVRFEIKKIVSYGANGNEIPLPNPSNYAHFDVPNGVTDGTGQYVANLIWTSPPPSDTNQYYILVDVVDTTVTE